MKAFYFNKTSRKPILSTIDLYIIKKFLGTFFFAISLIIVIVIIFDISEKIDDFLEKDAPLFNIIFDYYLNFIPYFVNLFSPLFTFIAVIFFTSKMASNTEIVAILSSGISFWRVLKPYLIASIVLAVLSFTLSNFIIPPANKKRIAFEDRFIKNQFGSNERYLHKQIAPGVFTEMDSYNSFQKIGYQFSMEKIQNGYLYYRLYADNITWDTLSNKWRMENYYIREVVGMKERLTRGVHLDTALIVTPKDFKYSVETVDAMNLFELNDFIEREKMRGSDNLEFCMIEKYRRVSFPCATIILTLIGVSLSSRKVRGGIGWHIGAGITISFAYILFMQVSNTFSTNSNLHPMIAVWIPNIIFLFLAVFLLLRAPK